MAEFLSVFMTAEGLVALVTLALLEIVLGIDNIVFIAVITSRLEKRVQPLAQRIGLLAAMATRIVLLLGINWIISLDAELFAVFGHGFSGKALILLAGGLFLLAKATFEIHHKLEAGGGEAPHAPQRATFAGAIAQIAVIDAVFSLDSVITAVGMAKHVEIMIVAIVIAIAVMMIFATPVSNYIERHPTLKMLALSFLLLIGVMLVADGMGKHINRGYIYFAMGFSLFVELLNLRVRRKRPVLRLNMPNVSRFARW